MLTDVQRRQIQKGFGMLCSSAEPDSTIWKNGTEITFTEKDTVYVSHLGTFCWVTYHFHLVDSVKAYFASKERLARYRQYNELVSGNHCNPS